MLLKLIASVKHKILMVKSRWVKSNFNVHIAAVAIYMSPHVLAGHYRPRRGDEIIIQCENREMKNCSDIYVRNFNMCKGCVVRELNLQITLKTLLCR